MTGTRIAHHPIHPGRAIDDETILWRRRNAFVASLRVQHQRQKHAPEWTESLAKQAWRKAVRGFPGRDVLSDAMLAVGPD